MVLIVKISVCVFAVFYFILIFYTCGRRDSSAILLV